MTNNAPLSSGPSSRFARCAVPCALLLLSTTASAHGGQLDDAWHGTTAAIAAGWAHPYSGADHLAAMLAVGLWSALTMRCMWPAPLVFATMLLVGALLGMAGMAGVAWSAVEPAIAVSALVLGLLVVTRSRWPAAAGLALTAVFALAHGIAHGQQLGTVHGSWVLAGLLTATLLLHTVGIALGLAAQRGNFLQRGLPRASGSAVVLAGASALWPAVA